MESAKLLLLTLFTLDFLAPLLAQGYDDDYYYGSGDHDYIPETVVKFCRIDADCSFSSYPYCCVSECCTTPPRSEDSYNGAKTLCLSNFAVYTGVECPRSSDFNKIYCCYGGRRCCDRDDLRLMPPFHDAENDKLDHSGVTSMGAIAGFVFLAVIVAGTLLTLATRYIKIKVRREHRRAGIHSQAYIDAINRRANISDRGDDDNTTTNNSNVSATSRGATQLHQPSGIFYIQPIPEEEEEEAEEDGVGPPPSYDEAIAHCPALHQEEMEQGSEQTPEHHRRQIQMRPVVRSSRTSHINFENISLTVIKDNIETDANYAAPDRNEENSITLPKEGDSQA